MKQVVYLFCALALLLLLSACDAQKKPAAMEIMYADLTEAEQGVFQLMKEHHAALFDFALEAPAGQIQTRAYRLGDDGAWEPVGGGAFTFEEKEGRLALTFDRLSDGFRTAVQGQGMISNQNEAHIQEGRIEESVTTGFAQGPATKIVWDEEIPLALQIVAPREIPVSCSTTYYFRPENLTNQGYEQVYAVTVAFSKAGLT